MGSARWWTASSRSRKRAPPSSTWRARATSARSWSGWTDPGPMRLPRALGLVGLALALAHGCAKRGPLVAFLGDSLTSGWKLPESQAYPAQLQRALRQQGRPIRVINAGVSGDTVAQGLKRLPALLRRRPDVLVVALGINDGLRGLPPETAERGLRQILTLAPVRRGARARLRRDLSASGRRVPRPPAALPPRGSGGPAFAQLRRRPAPHGR